MSQPEPDWWERLSEEASTQEPRAEDSRLAALFASIRLRLARKAVATRPDPPETAHG